MEGLAQYGDSDSDTEQSLHSSTLSPACSQVRSAKSSLMPDCDTVISMLRLRHVHTTAHAGASRPGQCRFYRPQLCIPHNLRSQSTARAGPSQRLPSAATLFSQGGIKQVGPS